MNEQTKTVIERFDRVFQPHDPSDLANIIAENCVLENTGPAPDGATYQGYDACVEFWQSIATNKDLNFDTEGIDILGDRGIIRWRLHWGETKEQSVRGVNIMRVKDGKVVEALGYVKA
ncbi:MAG TPA: nuclear transport factor 2 family protein [Patescibacteria group bacterium]|nr:nuclear transport factor 2 family protein [Patescibacteria group bacterium]